MLKNSEISVKQAQLRKMLEKSMQTNTDLSGVSGASYADLKQQSQKTWEASQKSAKETIEAIIQSPLKGR